MDETQKKLKVLHIGKYFPPHFGGIETFMSQLMLEQEKAGLEVSAIVHQNASDYDTEQQDWNGCKIYNVKSYGQLAYAPIAPNFLLVLRSALKDVKPDVVHIHMPNFSAFWLLFLGAFKKADARWVIHWHSDVVGAVPDLKIKLLYPFYRLFERWLLNKAEAVICTSPNYLQSSKPLNAFRGKCHVIPLGISLPEGKEQTHVNPHPDDDRLRLICIGRLTYYKGHQILFEAIKQLRLQGKNVELDVVGEGELDTRLKAIVKKNGLDDYIRFHGAVTESEKCSLLRQADLLCLPSIERTEAFGMVLLEAAELAKPALVTDIQGSGMTYVVRDKETGLVVKANEVESLIEAIVWGGNHRWELKHLGKSARQRLINCFSLNDVEKKICRLYAEIKSR